MGLNDMFNASINTSEPIGNISLLNPNYTGINWVRDNFLEVTGGDGGLYILIGLFVALFFVFVALPNVSRYASILVSSLASFLIGLGFWYWGLLLDNQVYILFILFIIFGLSAIGLWNKSKDERESIQV